MESCDETHTSIADEFEERAKNVDLTTTHPHSSCYDGLMEQTDLLRRARKHQDEARKIRKIFLDIDKEGKSIPADGEMLRKGVLTVSRGKALFSTNQLIQVCIHMFEDLPFVAFKGPTDARPYVVVIFSADCQYGDVREVKTRLEIFKKEAAVENFLIRFKVESICIMHTLGWSKEQGRNFFACCVVCPWNCGKNATAVAHKIQTEYLVLASRATI